MKRRGQGSIEYLLMMAIAIVMILVFVRRFFDPRMGTVKKTGHLASSIEEKVSDNMTSEIYDK